MHALLSSFVPAIKFPLSLFFAFFSFFYRFIMYLPHLILVLPYTSTSPIHLALIFFLAQSASSTITAFVFCSPLYFHSFCSSFVPPVILVNLIHPLFASLYSSFSPSMPCLLRFLVSSALFQLHSLLILHPLASSFVSQLILVNCIHHFFASI